MSPFAPAGLIRIVVASTGLIASGAAIAHPHVFVTATSEIVYDADQRVMAVRQHWTFDDVFSSFATQGLDANNDGAFSREELAPLAKVNVESLKDFGYFTFAELAGGELAFTDPVDDWLDHDGMALTLHFTLPLGSPVAQGSKPLVLEIYDPSYYVAFDMARGDPVAMIDAPTGCALNVHRASDPTPEMAAKLQNDDFVFSQENLGEMFANKILVNCP